MKLQISFWMLWSAISVFVGVVVGSSLLDLLIYPVVGALIIAAFSHPRMQLWVRSLPGTPAVKAAVAGAFAFVAYQAYLLLRD